MNSAVRLLFGFALSVGLLPALEAGQPVVMSPRWRSRLTRLC